jgi:putative acetyltransferase
LGQQQYGSNGCWAHRQQSSPVSQQPNCRFLGYNSSMPAITPIQPEQTAEARQVIYSVAHQQFHSQLTFAEAAARYETTWPIPDIEDYQHAYNEKDGAFLVMCADERIIATGALRRLEEGIAEIKRLWLLPEFQGQGLGYQMMSTLISLAKAKGYHTLRLETSPAYQQRAYAFYHQLGFRDIPRYGDDPDDIGMEMVIQE